MAILSLLSISKSKVNSNELLQLGAWPTWFHDCFLIRGVFDGEERVRGKALRASTIGISLSGAVSVLASSFYLFAPHVREMVELTYFLRY